jgi:hypothetical protein
MFCGRNKTHTYKGTHAIYTSLTYKRDWFFGSMEKEFQTQRPRKKK